VNRAQLPNARLVGASLTLAAERRRVTNELAAVELPACFAQATVSAALNAHERTTNSAKASRRRLLDKATRLAGVQS